RLSPSSPGPPRASFWCCQPAGHARSLWDWASTSPHGQPSRWAGAACQLAPVLERFARVVCRPFSERIVTSLSLMGPIGFRKPVAPCTFGGIERAEPPAVIPHELAGITADYFAFSISEAARVSDLGLGRI